MRGKNEGSEWLEIDDITRRSILRSLRKMSEVVVELEESKAEREEERFGKRRDVRFLDEATKISAAWMAAYKALKAMIPDVS